ncbi:MAG: hypothetical protein K9L23_21835 [Desulfotignum sp.]|nr:hypothetical protein [Desulfotignum sp.]
MTLHLIVSVGTSIISNFQDSYKKKDLKFFHNRENPLPEPKQFYKSYQAQQFQEPKCTGAEEKSIQKVLGKKKYGNPNDCHFHLIVTDTPECRFCASYLGHEVLKGKKVTYYVPDHLGDAKDASFVKKGVPSLLSTVAEILDNVDSEGNKAVIIPTGGYKAIIPYMTISALLYKIPIYYIYQDSEQLLALPAPPLGVDSVGFRSALVLMENIVGGPSDSAVPYLTELSDSYQSLIYPNDRKVYQYTAFGERLRTMFNEQPASPLAVRVAGNTLLSRLGERETDFREITRLGETIWIGDKAPEMADHARYHHINLLAYAELLLLPLIRNNPNLLSNEGLFLLLGMIYLHDCGHSRCLISMGEKGPLPLLPTEIRNFHNLLGYQRMTDPAFSESLERQGLYMNEATLKNIALLSLYHRKKMPLLEGNYKAPDGFTFQAVGEQKIISNSQQVRGDLLLALFRIIDGMDKQIGRAGDAIEISMRAESILADLTHLKHRIDRLTQMMQQISPESKKIADKILSDIFADYQEKEKPSSEEGITSASAPCHGYDNQCPCKSPPCMEKNETTKYQDIKKQLKKANLTNYLPLTWEYLESRVRFMFLALQPSYYYSDLLLTMPRVSHCEKNGKRHITINYLKNEDSQYQAKVEKIWKKIGSWIKANIKDDEPEKSILNAGLDTPEKIVAGIRDEYCSKKYSEVAKILFDNNMTIEFQLNGSPVSCWQKNE